MVLAGIDQGLLIGIGFGIFGVLFWVGGLLLFRYLLNRYDPDAGGPQGDS